MRQEVDDFCFVCGGGARCGRRTDTTDVTRYLAGSLPPPSACAAGGRASGRLYDVVSDLYLVSDLDRIRKMAGTLWLWLLSGVFVRTKIFESIKIFDIVPKSNEPNKRLPPSSPAVVSPYISYYLRPPTPPHHATRAS